MVIINATEVNAARAIATLAAENEALQQRLSVKNAAAAVAMLDHYFADIAFQRGDNAHALASDTAIVIAKEIRALIPKSPVDGTLMEVPFVSGYERKNALLGVALVGLKAFLAA